MRPPEAGPRRFAFLMLPGFPLMSYASAAEPLRAANHLAGRPLYAWRHLTPDGLPCASSSGVTVAADARLAEAGDIEALFICAGGNPALYREPRVFARLRALDHDGVLLAGMSGGAFVLARAGLLGGYRCTIHWEHIPALEEEFPALDIRRTLYEADRGRLTCAGGIASLDMMLAVIEQDHGADLSAAISEWFLRTEPRPASGPQRMALSARHGVTNPHLLAALALMERRIEEPLSCAAVAASAGVSPRQLERLFLADLGISPQEHYRRLRLERARGLLRQTAMSITAVALACGFASPSHFARAYRARFARAPRADRRSPFDQPRAP